MSALALGTFVIVNVRSVGAVIMAALTASYLINLLTVVSSRLAGRADNHLASFADKPDLGGALGASFLLRDSFLLGYGLRCSLLCCDFFLCCHTV